MHALASIPRATYPISPTVRRLQVANNRYLLFGRTNACRLSDPRFDDRFLSS